MTKLFRNKKTILAATLAGILLIAPAVSAQTLSSPNYQIENPTIDSGGEPSSSTNYRSVDAIGDSSGESTNSSTFKALLGFIFPSFPGVPGTPTLINTGGTLYNSLDFVITTGGNQTDTNYAIAISSDDFVTTNYIQVDDTVGTTAAWQSYTNWGGATGERVTGLSPSTTYKIKVKARYGTDSETGFSVIATAATSAPSMTVTFAGVNSGTAVAGETTTITTTVNAISYGSLIIDAPAIAAHKTTVSTNATGGYTTTVRQDGNLRTDNGQEISAVTASNASPAAWPSGITTGRFGYHTTDSVLCTGTAGRFSSNDTYAALTASVEETACNTANVTNEETTVVYKLQVGSLQQAGSYQNRLTYITTAQF